MLRGVLAALMLVSATFGLANAQTSIKIGVLNDQSGPLADFGGSGDRGFRRQCARQAD